MIGNEKTEKAVEQSRKYAKRFLKNKRTTRDWCRRVIYEPQEYPFTSELIMIASLVVRNKV